MKSIKIQSQLLNLKIKCLNNISLTSDCSEDIFAMGNHEKI
jgi:hypothetical protein